MRKDESKLTAEKQKSLQEILGISDQFLEKGKAIADNALEEKDYDNAADAFYFLASIKGEDGDLWLGLGLAEQERENYPDAVEAFQLAYLCSDQETPFPLMFIAQCYYSIGEIEIGKEFEKQAFKIVDASDYKEEFYQELEMEKNEQK
jgi:tetratricopeptide (TPR) repeat protein